VTAKVERLFWALSSHSIYRIPRWIAVIENRFLNTKGDYAGVIPGGQGTYPRASLCRRAGQVQWVHRAQNGLMTYPSVMAAIRS